MDRPTQWVRGAKRRYAWAIAVVMVMIPATEAWWSLFSNEPLIPVLLGKAHVGLILGIPPWGILVPPGLTTLVALLFIYSVTRPPQPFIPDRGSSFSSGNSVNTYQIAITNGLPTVFHRCYARIQDIVHTNGQVEGLSKQGEKLMWGHSPDSMRETTSFGSLGGERLILAVYDRRDPEHFQIPTGINSNITLPNRGSYQITVEIGSHRSTATPSRFRFTIRARENGIEVDRITQLEP